MISIIHISDPHAEGETMRRLEQLAQFHPECDVLALTGDCTSNSTDKLPQEWDNWPQRLKLSVLGIMIVRIHLIYYLTGFPALHGRIV